MLHPYQLDDVYTINPNFLGIPSATLPTTANSPDLKPEFTTEIEIGAQFSFFKRKVELDVTWYDRNSTNLICPHYDACFFRLWFKGHQFRKHQ